MEMEDCNAVGGYTYTFLETVPKLTLCKSCDLPSRKPHQATCCGSIFCQSCLAKATTTANLCIACENPFTTIKDKRIHQIVQQLCIICPYKPKGCKWEGQLLDIENHLRNNEGCQFKDEKCYNNCGEVLQRQYLTNHVENECLRRKIECQNCNITGECQFIEGEHLEECPKLPLPCPNKCAIGNVLRGEMETHRKECPLEVVNCEYYNVGCKERMMRKELAKHESEMVKNHLLLTKASLVETLQSVEAKQQEQANQYLKEMQDLSKRTIKELTEKTENHLSLTTAKLNGQVDAKQQLYLKQRFEEIQDSTRRTMQELIETVRSNFSTAIGQLVTNQQLQAKQQTEYTEGLDKTTQKNTEITNNLVAQVSEAYNLIQQLTISLHHTFSSRLQNYSEELKRTDEPIVARQWTALTAQTALTIAGNQGDVAVVNMTEYNDKKNRKTPWYSNSFYLGKGYKMRMLVEPAGIGDGSGTHMSVHLVLMKGPFDASLIWPLRGEFEVVLCNQVNESKHHKMIVHYNEETDDTAGKRIEGNGNSQSVHGYNQFIANEELFSCTRECQYLKMDCIFLKVKKL